MDHSLFNPNQLRYNGFGFLDNPYDQMHELAIEVYEKGLQIPMKYNGTKVIFTSSAPIDEELNRLQHVELTSDIPCDPGEVALGQ